MFIPDPDLYASRIPDHGSRIPDPTTAPKEEGAKNFVCPTTFCHKYHKIVNNSIFEQVKNFFSQNTKNYFTFTQKYVIFMLSEI